MTELAAEFSYLEQDPLWEKDWRRLVESLKAFHMQWSADATAAGWTLVELYGLNDAAPYARLDHWGAAFLASLPDRKIVGVDASSDSTHHRARREVVGVQAGIRWRPGVADRDQEAALIMLCPKCNGHCQRDSVHNGLGWQHGPYGCEICGQSEDAEYDLSTGRDPVDANGGAIDQYGGYHPPGSSMALAYRLARSKQEKPT